MDRILSFNPPQPSFTALYEFERVLAVPPVLERTLIALFRKRANANEKMVVRFLPDTENTQHEINVLHQVEDMRVKLGLDTIISSHGYMTCKDPFETYRVPERKTLRAPYDGVYFGILMDYVPLTYEDLNPHNIDEETVIAFTIDLLYTLWVARRDFQFYHGDLHIGNIMFIKLPIIDRRVDRTYVVQGHEFNVESIYLPVIIDFEKVIFGQGRPKDKEGLSDVRHIMGAMRSVLAHFGKKESPNFKSVYNATLAFDFKDDRFHPETIANILTTYDLFKDAREELDGDEEPDEKKLKACLNCNAALVAMALQCSACRAEFCSNECAERAWTATRRCHYK